MEDGEKELARENKVSGSGQDTDRDSEDDKRQQVLRDTTAGGEDSGSGAVGDRV